MEKRKAKELYQRYQGSKFQMMRDGFYQEYLTYNVSKEEEDKWLEELVIININNLNINDIDSFSELGLLLRFNLSIVNFGIVHIMRFLEENEKMANDKFSFLKFSQKVISIIDYCLNNQNGIINKRLLEEEKQILVKLRNKYL
ncbi:MAG: hypothetical protein LBQ22_07390 [Bacteroidales bacterium]|nr:hypothetical protein [Bacteroidales bacterium]